MIYLPMANGCMSRGVDEKFPPAGSWIAPGRPSSNLIMHISLPDKPILIPKRVKKLADEHGRRRFSPRHAWRALRAQWRAIEHELRDAVAGRNCVRQLTHELKSPLSAICALPPDTPITALASAVNFDPKKRSWCSKLVVCTCRATTF